MAFLLTEGEDLESRLLDHTIHENQRITIISSTCPQSITISPARNQQPELDQHSRLGLGLLGTLQSDDQGDGQLKLLGRLDDSFGNDVASHDSTDYRTTTKYWTTSQPLTLPR